MTEERSHSKQVLGSLLGAVVIIIATIAVVTANLGTGLDPDEFEARQEAMEERREEIAEQLEEKRERLQDIRERLEDRSEEIRRQLEERLEELRDRGG